MEKKLKKFDLHWLTGEIQRVEGRDIADAFSRAGLGAGALPALDYYSNVKESPNKACSGRVASVRPVKSKSVVATRH